MLLNNNIKKGRDVLQKEGLSEKQVIEAREKYGENKIKEYKKKSFFKKIFDREKK